MCWLATGAAFGEIEVLCKARSHVVLHLSKLLRQQFQPGQRTVVHPRGTTFFLAGLHCVETFASIVVLQLLHLQHFDQSVPRVVSSTSSALLGNPSQKGVWRSAKASIHFRNVLAEFRPASCCAVGRLNHRKLRPRRPAKEGLLACPTGSSPDLWREYRSRCAVYRSQRAGRTR